MRMRIGRERRVSLDEATQITGTLSRRRFLQAGGVAGAGLLLGGCTSSGPRSTPPSALPTEDAATEPRIAIVGAGLAGLAAAYWLTRTGVRVRVYEARPRVGGRCWSARGFDGGQVAEHGGEFVDTRHVHIARLAEELGLELDDLWSTWISGSRWPTYVDGQIVRSGDLFEPLDEAAKEIGRIAERNGPWWAAEANADARTLDEMSMADWFDANVPGGIGSTLGRAFSLEQAAWYGLDPDHLSATNLIDFYAVDYPGGDERYTVHGGNDQIPDLIHRSLPDGTVHLETPLEALRRRRDGAVELRFGGMSSRVIADRVILALPFTALRRADLSDSGLSATKSRSIEELGMGTNSKLLLQFSSDHHSFGGWSGGMDRVDDPMFTTWESSSTDDPSASRMSLITVYSGGHTGAGYAPPQPHGSPTKRVVAQTLAAMDSVVPGVGAAFNGKAWLDSWVDDPWAGGSYAAFMPGQYSRFSGITGTQEGTIHVAGEHTSSFSQGFLNGGVESGERAAVEVLEALGIPVPPGLRRTMMAALRYRPRYPW